MSGKKQQYIVWRGMYLTIGITEAGLSEKTRINLLISGVNLTGRGDLAVCPADFRFPGVTTFFNLSVKSRTCFAWFTSFEPSKQLSIIDPTILKISSSVMSRNLIKRTQPELPGRRMASVTSLKKAIHDWIKRQKTPKK